MLGYHLYNFDGEKNRFGHVVAILWGRSGGFGLLGKKESGRRSHHEHESCFEELDMIEMIGAIFLVQSRTYKVLLERQMNVDSVVATPTKISICAQ